MHLAESRYFLPRRSTENIHATKKRGAADQNHPIIFLGIVCIAFMDSLVAFLVHGRKRAENRDLIPERASCIIIIIINIIIKYSQLF